MRRFAMLALSLTFLVASGPLFAQDEPKKAEAPKEAAKEPAQEKPAEAKPAEPAKPAEVKAAVEKAAEPAKPAAPAAPAAPVIKPIPPEVQAKLEAARKAVAEAIVAAENAGLVDTSISDPPPILDILITGQANDTFALKGVTKDAPEAGVSPEVFGAWFTGFGKPIEGITPEANVRIVPPSKGLTEWYKTRAAVMGPYLAEARKANPKPSTPAPAEAPAAAPAATPKEEMKKEEAKKEEAPKEEPKKEEPKKEDAPKEEPKKEEPKPADAPKEEPKKEEPKRV